MGKHWKEWDILFLGGSKITADGDCSHEIKRCLLLGRKAMTNLNSILTRRGITLPTNVHIVKAMVFSIVMHGCKSCTIKKIWASKNWCFWTVVLEKTLESPLDSKRASLVAQRLKRLPAMWETWVLSLGREDPLEKEMATHSSILAWRIPWTEEPGGLQPTGSQRVGHDWSTLLTSNQEREIPSSIGKGETQSQRNEWHPSSDPHRGFRHKH